MIPDEHDPVERLKAHLEKHKHREQVFVSTAGLRALLDRGEDVRQRLGSEMTARSQAQVERYQLAQRVKELETALADTKAHVAHLTEALERRGEILFGQQGD